MGWKRVALITLGLLGLLVGVGGLWLSIALDERPDLSGWYARHGMAPAGCEPERRCLRARWLGVATLALSDGETTLLTDGFFTRIPMLDLLLARPVPPDEDAIDAGLARAGLERAAAVMVVHSHYDHAMDAGVVASRLGARLLGSASTAQVGRGAGLPEAQIVTVVPGEPIEVGAFRVTFYPSRHVPLPTSALDGVIEAPIEPPAPYTAYKMGGAWSIVIEHPLGNLLVQGSAGWVEGALDGVEVDTVVLGTGGLATQGQSYTEDYYQHLVRAVGARRVLPIHWDDFTLPPGVVVPSPPIIDDVEASFEMLESLTRADGIEMRLLPAWEEVVLFRE